MFVSNFAHRRLPTRRRSRLTRAWEGLNRQHFGAVAAWIGLGLIGCTTITVDELDAFDRKRTVNMAALRARGIQVEERRLTMTDGIQLDVRHFFEPTRSHTVLFFGGNGFLMATARDLVDALLDIGVNVVMVDYRGYGQSDGTPSVAAIKGDALTVYAFAVEELGVPPERLLLHGHSMGTLVATWVATERPARALVLESPVTNIEDVLDRMTPWFVDLFLGFEVAPALKAERNGPRLAKLRMPVLMLVGEDDNVTPPSMATDLAKTSTTNHLIVIPNRGHNDLPVDATYRKTYRDWLAAPTAPASDS